MTDDLDDRLRRDLTRAELPRAPERLRVRLRAVVSTDSSQVGGTVRRPAPRLVLGLAAILMVGVGLVSLAVIGRRTPPTTVDGMPVMTVSEAIAAHQRGTLPDGRAAIRGFWSVGEMGHMCASARAGAPPGELEIYCHDGEYGIAERDEPMFVVDQFGYVTYEAKGPHLSPWVSGEVEGVDGLFGLPRINGQQYPPVPIVVVGHFDDPRAAQCRPENHQLCLNRLVIDRIVEFDVGSVPTPGVTPEPTAFPEPPPSALFGPEACAGNVPYSFTGWTTTQALELPFDRPGHVYAMVTRDVILLTDGGWQDDPNGSDHQFQIWGQKICVAEEDPHDSGAMSFDSVPSSTYVLWDDGARTPGNNPLRPPDASQGPQAS